MAEPKLTVKVWDAPVRLFHWSVVTLLIVSWWTYEMGNMRVHAWSGYAMLALLIFRILWGFVGSESARFARFVASPPAALRHLLRLARREPDTALTHNPAGGWMVLAMLALLLVQAATGLMANDDVVFDGPLAAIVGKDVSDAMTRLHHQTWTLILYAVGLHILAIGAYAALKGHDLLGPMVSGEKEVPASLGSRAPRLGSPLVAASLFGAACVAVAAVAGLG